MPRAHYIDGDGKVVRLLRHRGANFPIYCLGNDCFAAQSPVGYGLYLEHADTREMQGGTEEKNISQARGY